MYYYKEYKEFIVNIHIDEKLKFYCYKYFLKLKSIVILITYIKIKYNIMTAISDKSIPLGLHLFFHNYFNKKISYINTNRNWDVYSIIMNYNSIYYKNSCYFFFLSYFYKEFKDYFFMQLNNKKSCYRLSIVCDKLINSPSHYDFYIVKHTNSFIVSLFKTNTENYFINKIFYSHTFLNIL